MTEPKSAHDEEEEMIEPILQISREATRNAKFATAWEKFEWQIVNLARLLHKEGYEIELERTQNSVTVKITKGENE